MTIIAIRETKDGSFMKIQAIHFLEPVTLAINIKRIAGIAEIAAKIDNFSIVFIFLSYNKYKTKTRHLKMSGQKVINNF